MQITNARTASIRRFLFIIMKHLPIYVEIDMKMSWFSDAIYTYSECTFHYSSHFSENPMTRLSGKNFDPGYIIESFPVFP